MYLYFKNNTVICLFKNLTMKKFQIKNLIPLSILVLMSGAIAYAATTPNPEMATSFGILSSTYTNTASTSPATVITGDLGYTTGPAVTPTVTGDTFVADNVYSQAGTDQNATLVALAAEVCTYSFPDGPIDLSTDNSRATTTIIGTYTPGVYCINGAASIGTGGITLDGNGTYIFRINGALTTVASSSITLQNSASACDIWWTPTEATTLGANTTFIGNIIDAAGVTIGNLTSLIGRVLAFGGTVTTSNNSITVPSACNIMPRSTLTLIKTVTNDNGGNAVDTDWTLSAIGSSTISGLSRTASTTRTIVSAGTYTLSESAGPAGYTAGIYSCVKNGGAAVSANTVSLVVGDRVICTINNNDNQPVSSGGGSAPVIPRITPLINITKTPNPSVLPLGPRSVIYTYIVDNQNSVPLRDVKVNDDKCVSVNYVSGDLNNDSKLESDEKWTYTCTSKLLVTTTNLATVIGYDYGGMPATDSATATVVVSNVTPAVIVTSTPAVIATTSVEVLEVVTVVTPEIPKLPNTGLSAKNTSWNIIVPGGILISLMSLYVIKRKQKI